MLRTKVEHEVSGRNRAVLGAVAELAACSADELARIDDLAVEVVRPAGTVLQRAGRQLRQAVVVLGGTVAEQGTTERTLGAGALVGAGLLSGDRVGRATVVATSKVRLLVFGVAEMEELGSMAGIRALADGARVPAVAPERAPRPTRTRLPGLAAPAAV